MTLKPQPPPSGTLGVFSIGKMRGVGNNFFQYFLRDSRVRIHFFIYRLGVITIYKYLVVSIMFRNKYVWDKDMAQ